MSSRFPPPALLRSGAWLLLAAAIAVHAALLALQVREIASGGDLAPGGRGSSFLDLHAAGENLLQGDPVYPEPTFSLPSTVVLLGLPTAPFPPRIGYLVLLALVELLWLAALWDARLWFREGDGTRYRLLAAAWLLSVPFIQGLFLGSTAGLAAAALAFLLSAHRERLGRIHTSLAAVAGALVPLTWIAVPAWMRRRSTLAAALAILPGAAFAAFLFSSQGSLGAVLDRILDPTPRPEHVGFRALADALGAWADPTPYVPRLIATWWSAVGLFFITGSLLLTAGARRPRVGPLVALWAATWFLASPGATEPQLVLLLPALLAWYARRPSGAVLLAAFWIALPSPFAATAEGAGTRAFLSTDPRPGLEGVADEAWRVLPLLLLYARAAVDLRLAAPVHARLRQAVRVAAPLLPLALAGAALLAFGLSADVFPIDDAYVHLVYARNLVEGNGMTFNPGETSTGSSAPLWTLVAAGLTWLPGAPLAKVLAASVASFLAATFFLFLLARRIARGLLPKDPLYADLAAVVAASAYALNGNAIWFAATGMETAFLQAIGLAAIWSYARSGFGLTTAVLAGLTALTRPEGFLVGALLVGCELLAGRRPFRSRIPALLVFVLLASPYFVWVRAITGSWMPSTFHGKTLTFVATGGFHLGAVDDFFRSLWGYWYFNLYAMRPAFWFALAAVGAAVLFTVRLARGARPLTPGLGAALLAIVLLAGWGILHFSAYAIRFRSLYHQARYLAPVFAVVAALAAGGIAFLLAWKPRRPALGGAWRLLVPAIALCLPAFAGAHLPFWRDVYRGNLGHIEHVHLAAAEWLRDNTPPDARVATFDIGVMGYVSGRHIADLGGLTDPDVHPYLIDRRCGPYLLERGISWIAHLENPPSEWYTGINRDSGRILRQTFVTSFEVPGYVQPVLTHSTKVSIFRLEPLERITPDLTGNEVFHPIDLSRAANAALRGDPFRPGYEPEPDLFPDLEPGTITWEGIPFRIPAGDTLDRTVLTTCYRPELRASLPLRRERGSALWLAVDGGRTLRSLTPCARFTVTYADGSTSASEVVPYSDVWDYWEQEEIPPERLVWEEPGTRQSLSSLEVPLDPRRTPARLTVETAGEGDEGIAIFAITQVVDGGPRAGTPGRAPR